MKNEKRGRGVQGHAGAVPSMTVIGCVSGSVGVSVLPARPDMKCPGYEAVAGSIRLSAQDPLIAGFNRRTDRSPDTSCPGGASVSSTSARAIAPRSGDVKNVRAEQRVQSPARDGRS